MERADNESRACRARSRQACGLIADDAVAVGAAKYCSHDPAVNSRLADFGDDSTAAAGDFGNRHVEGKEFPQKPRSGVSVKRQASYFLMIHFSSPIQLDSGARRTETFRFDQVALVAEFQQRLRSRLD